MSPTYDFSGAGEGKYTVVARDLFHYVDSNSNLVPIQATSQGHSFSLSGKLASTSRSARALNKRARFVECTDSQQSTINNAAAQAQTYAGEALS